MTNEMMMNVAFAIKFTLKLAALGAVIFTILCVIIGLIELWEEKKK